MIRLGSTSLAFACIVVAVLPAAGGKESVPEHFVPVPADEPIPARDFFRPSLFENPVLNRSGTYLAALFSNSLGARKLVIEDLATGSTDYKNGYAFYWLTDKLLMYYYGSKSYVVDVTNLHPKWYNALARDWEGRAFPVAGISRTEKPPVWAWTVDWDGNPCEVELLTEYAAVSPYEKPSTGTYLGYVLDKDANIGFAFTEENGAVSLQRPDNQHHWTKCPVDFDKVEFLGVGDRPDEILVLGPRQTGRPRAVQRMDALSGRMGEVLYQDRTYDFSGGLLYRAPVSRKLLGIQFYRRGLQPVWFDPRYEALQEQLEQLMPGSSVAITGSDDAEKRFIVKAWSDVNPGAYYLLDTEKHTLGILKKTTPWIDPSRMRHMGSIFYRTRDGFPVEAFLTLPAGATKENPPPLVVLPHGGPWVRNVWAFDPWVQFLASRGYAVFEPNYRGSPGYDWRFPESDAWDFLKMHHDVTDGVEVLVREGVVDKRRIAIMGGSFGGYLALCGAAYEGNLYRCAISLSGVFDWERAIKESRVYLLSDNSQMDFLRRHLGDPAANERKFNEISPLRHIDQVRIPIFVYHGYDDEIAKIGESQRLVSALEDNHVPHEVHFLEDEGHGLSRPEDATEIFTDIEAFLAKNLGVPRPN